MRSFRTSETLPQWIAQVEQRLSRIERKPLESIAGTTVRAVVMVADTDGFPVGLEPGTEVQMLHVDPATSAQTITRFEEDATTGAWRTLP